MFDLEEVHLTVDAYEAVRLSDLEGLSHEEAGKAMGVSRATFGRIILRARKIIADALVNGKAINIEGGNYTLVEDSRIFVCQECNAKWEVALGTGRPGQCPTCSSQKIMRVPKGK